MVFQPAVFPKSMNPTFPGLTIIYTGNGKGKTTAALGLALRASARGKKVVMLQFVKSDRESGEQFLAKHVKLPFPIYSLGLGFVGILNDRRKRKDHVRAARAALRRAKNLMRRCDVLILDEINGAIKGKLIRLADVISLIRTKPPSLTLVLTGRQASPRLVSLADLVTEMKEIKHPFQKGKLAQPGIDY